MRSGFLSMVWLGVVAIGSGACTLDVDVLPEDFVSTGSSFVISGTAILLEGDCPSLVWIADNGLTYHLFQDPRVDNEDFDRITTPGVRSRLQIAVRNDLEVACPAGTIVEVENVLEIVD